MAFRPRARRFLATLRAERRTLRWGLGPHAPSALAGFVAGLKLVHLTGRLDRHSGLTVLFTGVAAFFVAMVLLGVAGG